VLDRSGAILRVGQFWNYDAKKWDKVETSKFKELLGISAAPVDWGGDGDLDLRILVRLNEGTKAEPKFATESISVQAGGADAQVPHHAMPVAADWDGDGLFDLVTGSNGGAVYWFRNVGEKDAPKFAAPEKLVEDGAVGQRTQVAVADFDGEGDLDLLVGDYKGEYDREAKKLTCEGWVWLFRRTPRVAK
jgi:hypothetical protein